MKAWFYSLQEEKKWFFVLAASLVVDTILVLLFLAIV
jgi:hypothetical protein